MCGATNANGCFHVRPTRPCCKAALKTRFLLLLLHTNSHKGGRGEAAVQCPVLHRHRIVCVNSVTTTCGTTYVKFTTKHTHTPLRCTNVTHAKENSRKATTTATYSGERGGQQDQHANTQTDTNAQNVVTPPETQALPGQTQAQKIKYQTEQTEERARGEYLTNDRGGQVQHSVLHVVQHLTDATVR